MSKNIKLLIIDLDGTLVDSKEDITDSLNLTMSSFGYDLVDIALVAKYVGTGIRPIIESIVPKEKIAEFLEGFEKTYIANIANKSIMFSGWNEVFSQTPNIKKVVLSNKSQKFCDPLIKELKLQPHFLAVYGREAFSERKPSPVPFQEILKIHSFGAENTLSVGDMPGDIEGSKKADIKSCAALFGYGVESDLLKLAPDYTIKNPIELLDII